MVLSTSWLRVFRWLMWLLLLWIFMRGVVTFFPAPPAAASVPKAVDQAVRNEPPGLRSQPLMFAEEHLTWVAGNPDEHARRLAPYLAPTVDRNAGWTPGAPDMAQQATGSWIHSVTQVSPTRWLVSVAVRVSVSRGDKPLTGATLVLGVPVSVGGDGALSVYDLPTLLPGLIQGRFSEPLYYGKEITDAGGRIRNLVDGFFRAYLSAQTDLTYYLAPGVAMEPHRSQWDFESVTRLTVLQNGAETWALADVVVHDSQTDSRYTCRYTIGLSEHQGRWYVSQIIQKGE